jgi:hypothetical protein
VNPRGHSLQRHFGHIKLKTKYTTRIFAMGSAPSKPDPFVRSVEVISAGLSRTGTESMTLALERLLDGPVAYGGILCMRRTDGTFDHPPERLRVRFRLPVAEHLPSEISWSRL